MIGARVKIVVVSLGADGAAACIEGRVVAVDGYDVGPSIDTTGASDLFVAAWAWGDAVGLSIDDALRWAALYAALSVRVPTGAGGATRLARVRRGGLPPRPSGAAAARRAGRLKARALFLAALAVAGLACGGRRLRRRRRRRSTPTATATARPEPVLCRPLQARVVGSRRFRRRGRAVRARPLGRRRALDAQRLRRRAAGARAQPDGRLRSAVTVAGATERRLGGHRDPRPHALRRRHRRQPGPAAGDRRLPLRRAGRGRDERRRRAAHAALPRRGARCRGPARRPAQRHDRDRHQGLRRPLRRLHDPSRRAAQGGRARARARRGDHGRRRLRRRADDRAAQLRPGVRLDQAPRRGDCHGAAARAVRRRCRPDRRRPGRGARADPRRARVLHRARGRQRAAAALRALKRMTTGPRR